MTGRPAREVDVLISRLLIGKPDIGPPELRRLVPEVATLDDHAIGQKLAFLRSRASQKAPARPPPRRKG